MLISMHYIIPGNTNYSDMGCTLNFSLVSTPEVETGYGAERCQAVSRKAYFA
jgi:hypothetical protein